MSGCNLIHLYCQFFGCQNALLKKKVSKSDGPSFIVGQLVDQFASKSLNAPPLFLGVDYLVKVKNIGKRMATLFPRFQFVLDANERSRLQAAEFCRKLLE